ncbi:glycosyltransferase family A protein [Geminocystis sp. GBBB08]|uniref:glycosyltransferase family 2 protein n=1 Tax=Geminocystis sp. GBBB08 TaxID=2604140 RepID=UPI0027E2DB2F|nr:glycosyltransferase family A protein [Geminocystis sp. GBBB08]MBL1211026.1 glycosyltransferase family 2 protein [Geminocystis sp. GBBB08]
MIIQNPFISVIIPAFNAEKYLKDAIESVIKQNYQPLEIILIDDGSTDNTAKVTKSFQNIKYIYQENSGPAIARNNGIKIAKGEFIAFLDADDLWTDNHLELLVSCFKKTHDLEVAIGYVQCLFLKEKNQEKEYFEEFSNSTINVNLGAGLYKKSVFKKLGNFDPNLSPSEDVDWFLRIKEANINQIIVSETMLYYRIHDSNLSKDRKNSYSAFLKSLKMSLDRRKKLRK